jgi:hypothetical protein
MSPFDEYLIVFCSVSSLTGPLLEVFKNVWFRGVVEMPWFELSDSFLEK